MSLFTRPTSHKPQTAGMTANGFVDIHSHCLPGVDDGARDRDQALALLVQAHQQGVVHLVLTPHLWPGVYDPPTQSIVRSFIWLREAALKVAQGLSLSLASEVRVCEQNMMAIEACAVPSIGSWAGARAVLLEVHDAALPGGFAKWCKQLKGKGIQPILAHPERIKALMRKPQLLAEVVEAGCLTQLTCASLTGEFGEGAFQAAWHFIERDWAHFVASDAHHPERRGFRSHQAYQSLSSAFGAQKADELMVRNPSRLVDEPRGLFCQGFSGETLTATGFVPTR